MHFDRLDREVVAPVVAAVADPVEALRQIAHDYVRFGLDDPEHYRIMFMGHAAHTPERYDDHQMPVHRLLRLGDRAGVAAVDEGRLRAGEGGPQWCSPSCSERVAPAWWPPGWPSRTCRSAPPTCWWRRSWRRSSTAWPPSRLSRAGLSRVGRRGQPSAGVIATRTWPEPTGMPAPPWPRPRCRPRRWPRCSPSSWPRAPPRPDRPRPCRPRPRSP